MGLIEEFLAKYRKEYDLYSHAGRLVAQTLEAHLQAAGTRCMVTHRAKGLSRLEEKCHQRAGEKGYATVTDIFDDIVDLAGVRVALYFPAESDQVDKIIARSFLLTEPAKNFPDSKRRLTKRFSGYTATHYRVQLRETDLSEPDKRYGEARVEIQVASVLMHAWAEVEHDLVYKPLQGELSEAEYAILDQLNGLVIAGEIALEQLQKAGEARVATHDRRFANHYDLAAHLLSHLSTVLEEPIGDSGLGRIDLLYQLLARLELDTPDQLAPYLEALHGNVELRPVAEQVIDRLLAEDESRYDVYGTIRAQSRLTGVSTETSPPIDAHKQIGIFLAQWIRLERLVRSVADEGTGRSVMPTGRVLERLGLQDPEMRAEVERLRRVRNHLVHGIEIPSAADLGEAGAWLEAIVGKLERSLNT